MALKRQQDDERSDRLRAYDGKDYSEVIEFPVELVDRDGVVRRYSYEESLAVYHRRIQSAPWRYADDDLIRAEIGHCTRRIEQIKRSYATRTRHSGPSAASNPRASLGEGWEIVVRYYEAALAARRLSLNTEFDVKVALLQDEPVCRIYHLGFGARGGHLLYIYPFDRVGDGDPRESFEQAQIGFRGQVQGVGVERMLLAQAGVDAGFILTGSTDVPEGLRQQTTASELRGDGLLDDEPQPWWIAPASPQEEEASDPDFDEGVEALQSGRMEQAVEAFRRAVQSNPYHREAYLALLAALDGSGRFDEAELYGKMAGRHLPGDGLVRYRQGINHVRQGRLDEALAAFDEAGELSPALYQPAYFAAHVLVAKGRDLNGAIARLRVAVAADDGEAHVRESLAGLERCLALRRSMRVGGAALAALSALAVGLGEPLAAIGFAVGLVTLLSSGRIASAVARWLLQRGSPE